MNSQVFGCPKCSQRFQVLAEQAGQIVQCPACAQTMEIPADAFGPNVGPDQRSEPMPEAAPTTAAAADQIVACYHCQGQFRITPELMGQQIACPHCQQVVNIGIPAGQAEPADQGTSNAPAEEFNFEINTGPKRKSPRISIDSIEGPGSEKETNSSHQPQPEIVDLFPPKRAAKPIGPPAESKPPDPVVSRTPRPPASPPVGGPAKRQLAKPQSEKLPPSKPRPAKPQSEKLPPAKPPTTKPEAGKPASLPSTARPALAKPESTKPTKANPQSVQPQPVLPPSVKPDSKKREPVLRNPERSQPSIIPPTQAPIPDRRSRPLEPQLSTLDIQLSTNLLPPRFEVADPTRISIHAADDFKVFLPDGEGGARQFDQRILHVQHDGEQVSLIARTPMQRARRRMISNLVSVAIGILILIFAFWLLTQE